jgi:ubiquinone/menaquinone biosynthesis C-methylase UbiE
LTTGRTARSAGFDFQTLKKGATVVDVGGGTGGVSLVLAKVAPHLNIIVQDRPEVINGEAKLVRLAACPESASK